MLAHQAALNGFARRPGAPDGLALHLFVVFRSGDHSGPVVTDAVTSSAAASMIAASTRRSSVGSSTSTRVTAKPSAALTAEG